MAKSYRTAFIRVTAENTTEEGEIVYKPSDIEFILTNWNSDITYWFIEHPEGDEVSKSHYHVVIKFKSPTRFETIKAKFPYGKIENARNIKACVRYLVHAEDQSKVQYPWENIQTNCTNMDYYKLQSNTQEAITLQNVYEAIDKGEIREYNLYEKIPISLFAGNKTKIDNALIYYREKVCMDENRDINVIFISGPTGTGKTTFAKNYCESVNKRPCISSSSNDPLQDYKGQEVLILDDLRDSVFRFSDFLKLLDNHTKSSGKSRYHNKAFIGDTIIITSPKPITDWYFNSTPEDRQQLFRRVRSWFKFSLEKIEAFEYNDKLCKYVKVGSVDNYLTMEIREKAKVALGVFDAMGLEFTPEDRAILEDIAENGDSDKPKNYKETCKKKIDDYLPSK